MAGNMLVIKTGMKIGESLAANPIISAPGGGTLIGGVVGGYIGHRIDKEHSRAIGGATGGGLTSRLPGGIIGTIGERLLKVLWVGGFLIESKKACKVINIQVNLFKYPFKYLRTLRHILSLHLFGCISR